MSACRSVLPDVEDVMSQSNEFNDCNDAKTVLECYGRSHNVVFETNPHFVRGGTVCGPLGARS